LKLKDKWFVHHLSFFVQKIKSGVPIAISIFFECYNYHAVGGKVKLVVECNIISKALGGKLNGAN
jgi:hypothetical protein